VAGGTSDWLRARLAEQGLSEALGGRLVLLGRINDLALSALIENAACILLPIQYGGGSNLKTAEALLSGRRIVASPASMRGFDAFRGLPGVTVANGPAEFGAAVRSALADGSPALRSFASVAALTWDATLAPLVALVGELLDGNGAKQPLTRPPSLSTPIRGHRFNPGEEQAMSVATNRAVEMSPRRSTAKLD